jgi:hypothetical protein
MNTEDMPWLSEEFVPVADPDDLKTSSPVFTAC